MTMPIIKTDDCTLYNAEALAVLRTLPDSSVDSVVTDPPAGIEFMGKQWDSPEKWKDAHSGFGFREGKGIGGVTGNIMNRNPNCRRCKKHVRGKKGCRCPEGPDSDEDKEFRQRARVRGRDRFIAWLTEIMSECFRIAKPGAYALVWAIPRTSHWTGTAIEDAGWVIQDRISHLFGQGFPKHKSKLKPACEDWWLAWKPDRYATPLPGLDGCRIEYQSDDDKASATPGGVCTARPRPGMPASEQPNTNRNEFDRPEQLGRWPANVTLDEEAAAMLDEQSGELTSGTNCVRSKEGYFGEHGGLGKAGDVMTTYGDTGGASRFFYVAKASRGERNDGCEDLPETKCGMMEDDNYPIKTGGGNLRDTKRQNTHPTVKPIDLMRWLCRLITPPGGTVLDCFMGSGTTGLAALEEKFKFIGIEREEPYFEIAKRRILAPPGELFA